MFGETLSAVGYVYSNTYAATSFLSYQPFDSYESRGWIALRHACCISATRAALDAAPRRNPQGLRG